MTLTPFSTIFQKQTKFSFLEDGLLKIERSQNNVDTIVILIITEDMVISLRNNAPLLKKGDFILSYMAPWKQPYMQRFLERIEIPDLKAEK